MMIDKDTFDEIRKLLKNVQANLDCDVTRSGGPCATCVRDTSKRLIAVEQILTEMEVKNDAD